MILERVGTNPAFETPRRAGSSLGSIWIGGKQSIDVPCTVEIEKTRDFLFANVALDGIDVDYGDSVLVHAAPTQIAFGERSVTRSQATIFKANRLQRAWTRLTAYLELTELYEVGFQPKE